MISKVQEVWDKAKAQDLYYFCKGVCCNTCEDKPCIGEPKE